MPTTDLSERIPVVGTYYYSIEQDYVKVSQPGTGVEIFLTGSARRLWDYVESHKGLTLEGVARGLARESEPMPQEVVLAEARRLVDLRLLVLEDSGGW